MHLQIAEALPSLAQAKPADGRTLTVGVVQMHWQAHAAAHLATLTEGVAQAARAGAQVVFLPELTLSRYPADERPTGRPADIAEPLEGGPTHTFAAEAAAAS